MQGLVNCLASAPANMLHNLQQQAAAHVAPFRDFRRNESPNSCLQLLAGDQDPEKPIHCVPFLHWLLSWNAHHNKSTLQCQILVDDQSQLPGPCPLSLQQWNAELARHRSTLTFPGISRISIKKAELADPSGSTEPPWKRMLTRPN